MPTPTLLPLDLTGSAAGNLIIDEVHTFTVSQDRRFVPSAGPFYPDSLVVRDNVSGRIMVPILDYKVILPQRDAQMASGLDVSGAIWVNDTTAGSVRIRYQAVGGIYSNLYDTIVELLNNIPSNTLFGQVSWNQVFGQPVQYPPTSHMHDVRSLFNMGDVVNVLEKIRLAILTGDQGAFAAMYQYIANLLANGNYVTQTTFDDEVSARQAGDAKSRDLLKNASKLGNYATASLAAMLLGQLTNQTVGMIGNMFVDGHDLHIKPHGVMVQNVTYGDLDGLNTTIPSMGVNLNEFIQPMTTLSPSVDGYYLIYGRLTARADAPDTIYAPDLLADIADYHNVNEIEFVSSGPFAPNDFTGITNDLADHATDNWMTLAVGYVAVGNPIATATPQPAFTMTEMLRDMPLEVANIKARGLEEASSVAALGAALAHPVGDTQLYSPSLAPDTGAWLIGNVTIKGSFLYVDSNAVLLWNDAPTLPDLLYTPRKAVSRQVLTAPLADPGGGNYNHYLVYGRPVFGSDALGVASVEYYVMPAFTSPYPQPNIVAFSGSGHPFATVQDYLDFLTAGRWTHLFTAIRGGLTGDDYAIYPRGLVNRADTTARQSTKYYETITELKAESNPPKLAYVNELLQFFKWDPNSTATSDDVKVTYCMASFNADGLSAGRWLLAMTDYSDRLFNPTEYSALQLLANPVTAGLSIHQIGAFNYLCLATHDYATNQFAKLWVNGQYVTVDVTTVDPLVGPNSSGYSVRHIYLYYNTGTSRWTLEATTSVPYIPGTNALSEHRSPAWHGTNSQKAYLGMAYVTTRGWGGCRNYHRDIGMIDSEPYLEFLTPTIASEPRQTGPVAICHITDRLTSLSSWNNTAFVDLATGTTPLKEIPVLLWKNEIVEINFSGGALITRAANVNGSPRALGAVIAELFSINSGSVGTAKALLNNGSVLNTFNLEAWDDVSIAAQFQARETGAYLVQLSAWTREYGNPGYDLVRIIGRETATLFNDDNPKLIARLTEVLNYPLNVVTDNPPTPVDIFIGFTDGTMISTNLDAEFSSRHGSPSSIPYLRSVTFTFWNGVDIKGTKAGNLPSIVLGTSIPINVTVRINFIDVTAQGFGGDGGVVGIAGHNGLMGAGMDGGDALVVNRPATIACYGALGALIGGGGGGGLGRATQGGTGTFADGGGGGGGAGWPGGTGSPRHDAIPNEGVNYWTRGTAGGDGNKGFGGAGGSGGALTDETGTGDKTAGYPGGSGGNPGQSGGDGYVGAYYATNQSATVGGAAGSPLVINNGAVVKMDSYTRSTLVGPVRGTGTIIIV